MKYNKLEELLKPRKATYVEKTPNDVYREVANNFEQFEPSDIAAIGGVESQHGKYDEPIKGGSARGLFQFQPPTAEYLQPGSSETIKDINTQSELMTKYLKKNEQEKPEDAYVMHNLGKNRGSKFLGASDDTLIQKVIPARVIRANPGLYNVKTVGEAREKIKQKLQEGRDSSTLKPSFLDIFKE